jgi:hypothetical protein
MTRLIDSLYIRIAIAVVVGILLASVLTSFEQPCTRIIAPEEANSYCIELPKAAMYPRKLISDSHILAEYLTILAIGSIVSFALICIVPGRRKKQT